MNYIGLFRYPHGVYWLSVLANIFLVQPSLSKTDEYSLDLPRIVSSQLERIDFKVRGGHLIKLQSGERQIISAMMYSDLSDKDRNEITSAVFDDLELALAPDARPDRICVDYSDGDGRFLVTYLMRLLDESDRVRLRIDLPSNGSNSISGAEFLAYPALVGGTNVDESCDASNVAITASGSETRTLYPGRVGIYNGDKVTINFKINSGGGQVSIMAYNDVTKTILGDAVCSANRYINATHDRECMFPIKFPLSRDVRFIIESSKAGTYGSLILRIPG